MQMQVQVQVQVQVQAQAQAQMQLLAQEPNLRRTTAPIEGSVLVSTDTPWLARVRTLARRHGCVDGSWHDP